MHIDFLRDKFMSRFGNLRIERKELERMFRQFLWEEEEAERMRMILEAEGESRLAAVSSTSSASGGGGSQESITGTGLGEMVFYRDLASGNWFYRSLIFDGVILNPAVDTGISYTDFSFNTWSTVGERKGYAVKFNNIADGNIQTILFLSANGEEIERIELTTFDLSFVPIEGRWVAVLDPDAGEMWYFDGETVYYDNTVLVGSTSYGINNFSGDSATIDGFLLKVGRTLDPEGIEYDLWLVKADGTVNLLSWIELPGQETISICAYAFGKNVYAFTYDETVPGYTQFQIIDPTGTDIRTETLDPGNGSLNFTGYSTGRVSILLTQSVTNEAIYDYIEDSDILTYYPMDNSEYSAYSEYRPVKTTNGFNDYLTSTNLVVYVYYSATGISQGLGEVTSCRIIYFYQGGNFDTYDFELPEAGNGKRISPGGGLQNENGISFVVDDGDGLVSILTVTNFGTVNITSEGSSWSDVNNSPSWDAGASRYGILLNLYFNEGFEYYGTSRIFDNATFDYNTPYIIPGFPGPNPNLSYRISLNTIVLRYQSTIIYWNSADSQWQIVDGNYATLTDDTPYYNEQYLQTGNILASNPPRLYWLNDDGDGNNSEIDDGGDDLFDNGHKFETDIMVGGYIPYTHTQISVDSNRNEAIFSEFTMDGVLATGGNSSDYFGEGSSYFTNLYPGLFVMCATDIAVGEIAVSGDLGSDGNTTVKTVGATGISHNGTNYYLNYVSTNDNYASLDPSCNYLFIVPNGESLSYVNNVTDGNDSYDYNVSGDLATAGTVHILLTTLADTYPLTETDFIVIAENYLNVVDPVGDTFNIETALTNLNAQYEEVTANLPPHSATQSFVIQDETAQQAQIPSFSDNDLYRSTGPSTVSLVYEDPDRERKITINLYDLSGNLLQNIETEYPYLSGSTYESVHIQDMLLVWCLNVTTVGEVTSFDNGMYMVTPSGYQYLNVVTDEGGVVALLNDYVTYSDF